MKEFARHMDRFIADSGQPMNLRQAIAIVGSPVQLL